MWGEVCREGGSTCCVDQIWPSKNTTARKQGQQEQQNIEREREFSLSGVGESEILTYTTQMYSVCVEGTATLFTPKG